MNYICENDATHTDSKTEGHTFAEGKCDCGAEEVTNYVAMIGTKGYATLADAIAAVKNGETIRLLADITENITITQKKNVAFTIDGLKETATASEDGEGIINDAWYTCYATITVTGTKSVYDNNQGLTIQNLNFVLQKRGQVGIATTKSTYVRGLTVRNCTFTGSGAGEDAVYGINLRHVYDITVEDCTAANVYDLVYAQNSVDGLTVEDVTVTDSVQAFFLAYGTNLKFTRVNTDNVSVAIGVKNQTNNGTLTITDCNLSAETPVALIQASATNKFTVTFEGNTVVNTPEWLSVTDNDGNAIADSKFVVVLNGDDDAEDDVTAPAPYVAKIGTKGYATLAAAIANATAGETIVLLADISENVTLDKSLTIDGGNFKYTGTMAVNPSLTVTVENLNFVKGSIYKDDGEHGYLTVKNCNFDGENSVGYAITYNGDNIAIENSTAKNYTTGMLYVKSETHTISVKDVTIENVAAAFNITRCNSGTFENVKVSNATYGIHSPNYGDRTFTLTNCEFNCANPTYVPKKGTATVTFVFEGTGNTFTNASAYTSSYTKFVLHKDSVLTAPEVFQNEITTDAEGCKVVYENGAYRVIEKKNYVVRIEGGEQYESLTEAVAAASAGDTIVLLADITENVTVNKAVTINGADMTFTGMMTLKANTTIKNVKFDGKSAGTYAVEGHGAANIVIEDCTATNYPYGFLQIVSNNDRTTVKNVTITNVYYGIKIDHSNNVTLENVTVVDAVVAGIMDSNYGAKTITVKNCNISGTNGIVVWDRNTNTVVVDTFKFEGVNTVSGSVVLEDTTRLILVDANSTLTAQEDLSVTTDLADSKVVYEEGTYKVAPKRYVAKIGEAKFETLSEAITAAASGETITFMADITEDVTVSKNVTIDGADFQYTGKMDINNGKTVTVQNVNFVKGYIYEAKGTSGYLTVKNCDFDGVDKSITYAVTMRGGNKVTVEDCTAKGYDYGFLYINQAVSTVNVKNVTVENVNYGVNVTYGMTVNLENVTMTNVAYGVMTSNYGAKTINLTNCDISGTNPIYVWERDGYSNVDTFKFYGTNTLTADEMTQSQYAKFVLPEMESKLTAPADLTVTTDLAEHKVVYEEGTYKVAPMVYVAEVNGVKYESIQEAVNAAQSGDTVTVIDNHEIACNADPLVSVSGKDITIDLNGKAVTANVVGAEMTVRVVFQTESDGKLTMVDNIGGGSVIANGDGILHYMFRNYGEMTVKNGSYQLSALNGGAMFFSANNNMTVEGGTFKQPTSGWMFNTSGNGIYAITVSGGTYDRYFIGGADFNENPYGEVVLEDGYILKENEDGETWTVKPGKWVAEIAETGKTYETLAKAIAAVQNGETIVLLENNAEDVTIKQVAGKSFTIDGGSKTYSGTITVDGNRRNTGAETLTIQNVNFVSEEQAHIFIDASGSTYAHNITVDNCTFTGDGSAYGMKLAQVYNITVTNTTGTKLTDLVYGSKAVTGLTLKNVTVTDSAQGVWLTYPTGDISFENVTISNSGNVGVGFYNRAKATVTFEGCAIDSISYAQKTTNAMKMIFNDTVNNLSASADNTTLTAVLNKADATLTAVEGLNVIPSEELAKSYMVVYENGVYRLSHAIAQNIDTGDLYLDLSDGLAEAVSGETVILLADTAEDLVLVPAGVTFDLNGNVVAAKNALSFGIVKDSATDVGGIQISNDTTQAFTKLQPENGGYLPVYDSTNGMYKFFKFELVNAGCKPVNENKVRFGVKILFENSEAYNLLADEENNSCISLYLRITWDGLDGQYINYKFTASGIAKYATSVLNAAPGKSPALTLDITGISGLEAGESLSAAPWLETLTEVAADTEYATYTKQ